MKHLILMLSVTMSILTVGSPAYAGLHVEPFLGYLTGDYKSTPKYDISGTDMGIRLGYHNFGFSVGGELSRMDLEIDSDPDIDFEPLNMGLFVSYEFPILLRVYGSFIVSSAGDLGADGKLKDGMGYRLGVGFTGLPFIAINAELGQLEYGKAEVSGVDFSLDPDRKIEYFGLNISVPLTF